MFFRCPSASGRNASSTSQAAFIWSQKYFQNTNTLLDFNAFISQPGHQDSLKAPELLVTETQRTKKTYETIFSSVCSKCTTIVCCRKIITNGIYQYLFKLVFLADSMGVKNSMMGKNSAVYSAFLQCV